MIQATTKSFNYKKNVYIFKLRPGHLLNFQASSMGAYSRGVASSRGGCAYYKKKGLGKYADQLSVVKKT